MQEHSTQTSIDKLCRNMSNIIIDAAKGRGTSERKTHKSKQRPWFDQECTEERNKYYKVKNVLKRKGEQSFCATRKVKSLRNL